MQIDQAKYIFSLIDLTSLNESDTEEVIHALCQAAVSPLGHVAAVCIYPAFVKSAKSFLAEKPVKIATVANFPLANDSLENVLYSIKTSLQNGADEIDVVFPYKNFLAGEKDFSKKFIEECKKTCGEKILKVILETGALIKPASISEASEIALRAGADFIKTSTGKIAVGATLEAAETMLLTIKKLSSELKRSFGFKASGGVRTPEQAMQYIELASRIMGKEWVTNKHFRIGASQLTQLLLNHSLN